MANVILANVTAPIIHPYNLYCGGLISPELTPELNLLLAYSQAPIDSALPFPDEAVTLSPYRPSAYPNIVNSDAFIVLTRPVPKKELVTLPSQPTDDAPIFEITSGLTVQTEVSFFENHVLNAVLTNSTSSPTKLSIPVLLASIPYTQTTRQIYVTSTTAQSPYYLATAPYTQFQPVASFISTPTSTVQTTNAVSFTAVVNPVFTKSSIAGAGNLFTIDIDLTGITLQPLVLYTVQISFFGRFLQDKVTEALTSSIRVLI